MTDLKYRDISAPGRANIKLMEETHKSDLVALKSSLARRTEVLERAEKPKTIQRMEEVIARYKASGNIHGLRKSIINAMFPPEPDDFLSEPEREAS